MKKAFIRSTLFFIIFSVIFPTVILTVLADFNLIGKEDPEEQAVDAEPIEFREITGKIRKGETLSHTG